MTLRLQDVRIEPPAPLVPFVAEPTVIESSDDIAAEAVAKAEVERLLRRRPADEPVFAVHVPALVGRQDVPVQFVGYAHELRGRR